MNVKSIAKTIVKDTAIVTLSTGVMTGAAALTAPIIGVPALTGAVFVGTYALTANVTNKIAAHIFTAIGLDEKATPIKAFVCNLTAGAVSCGAGLGAAAGMTAALGMPITLGAGITTVALAALAVFVTGIALAAIAGSFILVAGAITYLVVRHDEKCQTALCQALNSGNHQNAANNVWNHFHPSETAFPGNSPAAA